MIEDSTKKPNLQDVIDELDRAEQRDTLLAWVGFVSAGFGFFAGAIIVSRANLIWLLGLAMVLVGSLAAYFRVSPNWHYRQKPSKELKRMAGEVAVQGGMIEKDKVETEMAEIKLLVKHGHRQADIQFGIVLLLGGAAAVGVNGPLWLIVVLFLAGIIFMVIDFTGK